MSRDLEGCLRVQHELFGRISRAYENLKKIGAGKITVGDVEARLQTLEVNWAKFESQHEDFLSSHWSALSAHDYVIKDMGGLAEETYLKQKGAFLSTLQRLQAQTAPEGPSVSRNPSALPRTTLPRIQLPCFSGKYEEWPSFRDMFLSIVGKDSDITRVEKLHYLKSCLTDEAALLVRNLSTTDVNYDQAWLLLTDYYENKRLLVRSYISRFTALKRLKSESASELRHLYHEVRNTVGSLESIGRPINCSEDLFVHLVTDLLDPQSRRSWEASISSSTAPPSYDALRAFLDRRLHELEALPPVKPDHPVKSCPRPEPRTQVLYAQPQSSQG